ncbi:MAG: hypothetical protein ACRYFS_15420 [Janthinobacterium lividum]
MEQTEEKQSAAKGILDQVLALPSKPSQAQWSQADACREFCRRLMASGWTTEEIDSFLEAYASGFINSGFTSGGFQKEA